MSNYPSDAADRLELYVRRRFSLTKYAWYVFAAIRWMEIDRSKFCGLVRINYRDIGEMARLNPKRVRPALEELQMAGLIDVVFGSPIKEHKRATEIRRKTLDALKAITRAGDGDAERLATALQAREFLFEGKRIKPTWEVKATGRVQTSKPNFQGIGPNARWDGLKSNLKDGYALVHADIKRAEPTVIKHLLKIPPERDPYREYMEATGCDKAAAKEKINTLANCKNSAAYFKHWPAAAQSVLRDYVEALHDYKVEMFKEAKKSRSVTTWTGRRMHAIKGQRLHAGTALCWRVQGTVADITNAACLRLLDVAEVVVPLHDAIYAVMPVDKVALVEAAMVDKAREIGIAVTVESKTFNPLSRFNASTSKTPQKPVKLYPRQPPNPPRDDGCPAAPRLICA